MKAECSYSTCSFCLDVLLPVGAVVVDDLQMILSAWGQAL